MSEVIIERAEPEDAAAVFAVQRTTWLATYPDETAGITPEYIQTRMEGEHGELIAKKEARWKATIESGERAVFVARLDGKVVGFAAPGVIDGQHRVGSLYVLPEAQGKGLGYQLLKKAVEWHGPGHDIYLRVVSYNSGSIAFYRRFGFIETGKSVIDENARQRGEQELPEIEMVLKAKS